jgi:hypothetical protein
MAIRTELELKLANSPGALAGVCEILADSRVNVLAASLEAAGTVRLVVDNHVHAAGALRERHFSVVERDVLVVNIPNEPGAFAAVGRMLAAASVNVDYMYGSAVEGSRMATVVVGVPDAQRASAAAGL